MGGQFTDSNEDGMIGAPSKLLNLMVPEGGLEPPRGYPHRILSPARLPFHHSGTRINSITYNAFGFKNARLVFHFQAVFKALATAASKWKLGSGEISGPRLPETPETRGYVRDEFLEENPS